MFSSHLIGKLSTYLMRGGIVMVEKRKSEDSPEQKEKERSNEDVEPQRDPDKPDHTGNQGSKDN
jgi:hypothetical protein